MCKSPTITALVLGLSLTFTACGSDDADSDDAGGTSSEVSTTEHNDADVTFASDMIQHHAQALSMVDLTMGRDLDPEVHAVADDIRAAQAPEIEAMADWLTEWGVEIPETVRDHANGGHDIEGRDDGDMGEMPGMMSSDDMAALHDASDAEFQDLWLDMMIEHHEGAVEMALAEEADGQYTPALDLAADIVEAQTVEIQTMQGLLS